MQDPNSILSAIATDGERQADILVRPQSIKDFIGQEEFLERMEISIQAARQRQDILSHVLLFGPPGLGKTTMARIIANEMGVGFRIVQGAGLDKKDALAAILTELNEGDVLFIDEIHRLNSAVEECLYPAMEDFEFHIIIGDGPHGRSVKLNLKPFTLVGATTRTGMISAPLRDRFPITERLRFYNENELKQIAMRTAKLLSIPIEENGATEVARRSRMTPRIVNRLIGRVRDYAQVKMDGVINADSGEKAFKMLGIDKLGLNPLDHLYLNTIIEKFQGGPVGLNSIAVAISEDEDTIEDYVEPYLIQIGFIKRTSRGRVVQKLAFDHLGLEFIDNES